MEKTGSTSIQEYLYLNEKKLCESGFYYFQGCDSRNSRVLAAYCTSEHKRDDYLGARGITSLKEKLEFKRDFLKSFRKEMALIPKKVHTVIISSEHLHSRVNTSAEVNNVYELLSSFFSKMKIVCYLREQLEACVSLYSTAIKNGKNIPFDDFLLTCKPENVYFNYYNMLSNWEKSFGLESLDVSLFDSELFVNGDLLDDFTAKINPALIGVLNKNITTENESLTYVGQVLGKAINEVFSGGIGMNGVNPALIKCHEIIYRNYKGKGESASINARNEIYNKFTESNEKIRKKYFPERKVLFKLLIKETRVSKAIDDKFIDVLSSLIKLTTNECSNMTLSDRYADIFRDAALMVEKDNPKMAYELMGLALKIRPSGPFIKQKLEEYRQLPNLQSR